MTPAEFAMYLFNGGVCLGFGTWLGKLWVMFTAGVVR